MVSVVVVLAGWLSAFGANACIGQTWREAVGTGIEMFVEFEVYKRVVPCGQNNTRFRLNAIHS